MQEQGHWKNFTGTINSCPTTLLQTKGKQKSQIKSNAVFLLVWNSSLTLFVRQDFVGAAGNVPWKRNYCTHLYTHALQHIQPEKPSIKSHISHLICRIVDRLIYSELTGRLWSALSFNLWSDVEQSSPYFNVMWQWIYRNGFWFALFIYQQVKKSTWGNAIWSVSLVNMGLCFAPGLLLNHKMMGWRLKEEVVDVVTLLSVTEISTCIS